MEFSIIKLSTFSHSLFYTKVTHQFHIGEDGGGREVVWVSVGKKKRNYNQI